MMSVKKRSILTLVIGILIGLGATGYSFGVIFGNGSGNGYEPGTGSDGGKTQSNLMSDSMEYYVIQGAGYYLNAHSDIFSLLNRFELATKNRMDSIESLKIVNSALANINLALKSYRALIQKAEVTPYRKEAVLKLNTFDYSVFKASKGLNDDVFNTVEIFLKPANITGAYKHIAERLHSIRFMLRSIKREIALNKTPGLEKMWKLNELSAETLLFGQYMARCFSEINSK